MFKLTYTCTHNQPQLLYACNRSASSHTTVLVNLKIHSYFLNKKHINIRWWWQQKGRSSKLESSQICLSCSMQQNTWMIYFFKWSFCWMKIQYHRQYYGQFKTIKKCFSSSEDFSDMLFKIKQWTADEPIQFSSWLTQFLAHHLLNWHQALTMLL